jgi:hypothetical protein
MNNGRLKSTGKMPIPKKTKETSSLITVLFSSPYYPRQLLKSKETITMTGYHPCITSYGINSS